MVTIGIVSWNSASDLPACLEAIHSQTYPNLELVIVDNASEDVSVSLVLSKASEALLIRSDANRGYSAGHNRAIEAAHGVYYLALNPDVVLEREYVAELVNALESRPNCASAMGKLWLANQGGGGPRVLDGTGLFIDRSRHQFLRGHGEIDTGQYDTAGEIFGVDGAAPLFRTTALSDLAIRSEVFDESYFLYMEDVDLSWRAQLMGWKAWYEPGATAVHDRSFKPGIRRTMPRHLRRLAVRNRYLTILKNEAPETWRRDWYRILLYDARIFGYILLMEQSSLKAYSMLWRQLDQVRSWRREVWSKVRVSPGVRSSWFV